MSWPHPHPHPVLRRHVAEFHDPLFYWTSDLWGLQNSLDLSLPYLHYPCHSLLENSAEGVLEPSGDHKCTLPDFPQFYLSPPLGMGIRGTRSGECTEFSQCARQR